MFVLISKSFTSAAERWNKFTCLAAGPNPQELHKSLYAFSMSGGVQPEPGGLTAPPEATRSINYPQERAARRAARRPPCCSIMDMHGCSSRLGFPRRPRSCGARRSFNTDVKPERMERILTETFV